MLRFTQSASLKRVMRTTISSQTFLPLSLPPQNQNQFLVRSQQTPPLNFSPSSLSLSLQKREFHKSSWMKDTWSGPHNDVKKPKKMFSKGAHGMPNFIEEWDRPSFYKVGAGMITLSAVSLAYLGLSTLSISLTTITSLYYYIGYKDMSQSSHTIRKNFPVLGNIRYFFEVIRPEIRQYLIEGDDESSPFSRVNRTLAYQRSKNMTDTVALGTKRDVYRTGYEFVTHSLYPITVSNEDTRTIVGGPDCKQPYSAALLNVSAMSFGALSPRAIMALNRGAMLANCYHNTGEGGISKFHLEGGDIVWNIGTGYFGCRDKDGHFCPEMFQKNATRPQVKMIELKLSQGAKPSKGGMLPAAKISPEIAEARGLGPGPWKDCFSPSRHSSFSNASEMIDFIAKLRELSGGKPVGFKMCIGNLAEFLEIVGEMKEKNIYPDFITIDGAEGGTGAAPYEYMNSVGMPLYEGLSTAHSILIGAGIRDKIKLIAAGKVVSGFSILRLLALGADFCNAARAMMFSLGCIQSHTCNTNKCPTGIATQDPERYRGLDVDHKAWRMQNFQQKTVRAAADIMGSIGSPSPQEIDPRKVYRRVSVNSVLTFHELYPLLEEGSLLNAEGKVCLPSVDRNMDGIVSVQEFRDFVKRKTVL